jgi:hypothetical protein
VPFMQARRKGKLDRSNCLLCLEKMKPFETTKCKPFPHFSFPVLCSHRTFLTDQVFAP